MKTSFVAVVAATIFGLAGCGPGPDATKAEVSVKSGAAVANVAQTPSSETAEVESATDLNSDEPPAFAVIYPGGVTEGPATLAEGVSGDGGLVTFTTDADADTIVAFYRQRAEAAGLASTTTMNQGEARAYGAAAAAVTGPSLQVVASPVEDGRTSVQLTWSAGA